jgi:ABC-2 type transport system permease protein
MAAETLPVLTGVLRDQRRSLVLWGIALAAVSAMYISFYPAMGGSEMDELIANLPEGFVTAMGYDRIGTPGGYITSTVYGLLGPALLLVFAIGGGARLIAGCEEDGTLELEFAAPVSRRQVFVERLLALWTDILALVAVVTVVTLLLVAALDMEIGLDRVLAGSSGLLLLVLGLGTVALAVGAATGRRAVALGIAAGLAVAAFMLNALGPSLEIGWMTAISPFSWYLENEPLTNGFDVRGLLLLAAVPIVAAVGALVAFERRDLMV